MFGKALLKQTAFSCRAGNRLLSTVHPTVVFTWGIGTNGELGHAKFEMKDGLFEKQYVQEAPRRLLKSKRFSSIAIGEHFTLALTSSGEVFGWGKDFINKSKETQSKEPVPIITDKKINFIAAGARHAAVIDSNGLIHTWGHGGDWYRGGGQLGHGNKESCDQPRLMEAFKKCGAKAASVSCGGQHTLILTDDGEVLVCGAGEYGRLGTGNSDDAYYPTPAVIEEDVAQICAGHDHSIALGVSGHVYGWGRNQSGQLGQKDSNLDIYSMEEYPRPIADLEDIVQVAAGNGRSAAVNKKGELFVWGHRISPTPHKMELPLFEGQKIKKVAIGGETSKSVIACLTEKNELWAFGDASSKMLGIPGLGGKHPLPMRVEALEGMKVVDIACGHGQHMAAFVEAADSS